MELAFRWLGDPWWFQPVRARRWLWVAVASSPPPTATVAESAAPAVRIEPTALNLLSISSRIAAEECHRDDVCRVPGPMRRAAPLLQWGATCWGQSMAFLLAGMRGPRAWDAGDRVQSDVPVP